MTFYIYYFVSIIVTRSIVYPSYITPKGPRVLPKSPI
jgi:hypothetical protein